MYYIGAVGFGYSEPHLAHHGIEGQKWGVRRFQNEDGSLTAAGRERYLKLQAYKEKQSAKLDATYERHTGYKRDSMVKNINKAMQASIDAGREGISDRERRKQERIAKRALARSERIMRSVTFEKKVMELSKKRLDEAESIGSDRARRARNVAVEVLKALSLTMASHLVADAIGSPISILFLGEGDSYGNRTTARERRALYDQAKVEAASHREKLTDAARKLQTGRG